MLKLLAVALAFGATLNTATANTATAAAENAPVWVYGVLCLLPDDTTTEFRATKETVSAAVAQCHELGGRVTGIALVATDRCAPGTSTCG
jgi:hypothetical protein